MSVDILPSELPLEASQHFSKSILPYLRTVIREYNSDSSAQNQQQTRCDPELRQALNRATVAFDGKLTERHLWLNDLLKADEEAVSKAARAKKVSPIPQAKKRVLLLGSGLVSRPFVDQICTRSDVECIVGQHIFPTQFKYFTETHPSE